MTPQPPPAPKPPEAPPLTPEQVKLAQKQRQLRISYGMVFGSEHGKVVLADLKSRFGWDGDIERPSYRAGMTFDQVANADGMKEVVRHVMAMQVVQDDNEKPRPQVATT